MSIEMINSVGVVSHLTINKHSDYVYQYDMCPPDKIRLY